MSDLRRTEPEFLGNIIGRIMRETGLEDSVLEVELQDLWLETVGENAAAVSKVQSFERGRLVIATGSSTWRSELLARKEAITQQINEKYGRPVVRELIIR